MYRLQILRARALTVVEKRSLKLVALVVSNGLEHLTCNERLVLLTSHDQ